MKIKQIFCSYRDVKKESVGEYKYCPSCKTELVLTEDGEQMRPVCPACRFIYYKNPAPAVSVFIIKDKKVLLGKRAYGSFKAGMWCLPCGFIEFDEDFLTAARREVKEETGLTVEIKSIISVMSNYLASNLHSLVVVLLASVVDGEAYPGDDLDEVEWFALDGPLPKMAFEADEHIIERYVQEKIKGIPVDTDFSMGTKKLTLCQNEGK